MKYMFWNKHILSYRILQQDVTYYLLLPRILL